MSPMLRLLMVLAATLACSPAWGQAEARQLPHSHGWFVVGMDRRAAPEGGAVVLDAPPRSGPSAASSGEVRLATTLRSAPRAWAGVGSRVYLVYEDPLPPAFVSISDPRPRQILTLSSVPADNRRWRTEPPGRLDVAPAADGAGELVDLVGSESSLYMLTRRGRSNDGLHLARLNQSAWEELRLPPEIRAVTGAVVVIGAARGVAIISPGPDGPVLHVGEIEGGANAWTSSQLGPEAQPLLEGAAQAALVGGRIAMVSTSEGGVVIRTRALQGAGGSRVDPGSAWTETAQLPGIGSTFILQAMPDDGRIVLLWARPGPKPTDMEHGIAEVSVATGRVLHNAPLRLASPVTGRDYLLLGLVLVMVLGMVGVAVIGAREGAIALPQGASIAEAPRRVIAGLIDIGLASLVVTQATGAGLSSVLSLTFWSGADGQSVFFQVLGTLIVVGSVCESFLGRTPGKLLTGCEVVSVIPGPPGSEGTVRRAVIWRTFVRNLIKWGLPPVGVLGVMDPGGRHRHDQLARTAVVVREVPEEDEESGPS